MLPPHMRTLQWGLGWVAWSGVGGSAQAYLATGPLWTRPHAQAPACHQARTRTHTHTDTQTHTDTHTHTHTHTHQQRTSA
jgi:carbohydrate-binding DOMON domain-containing protein